MGCAYACISQQRQSATWRTLPSTIFGQPSNSYPSQSGSKLGINKEVDTKDIAVAENELKETMNKHFHIDIMVVKFYCQDLHRPNGSFIFGPGPWPWARPATPLEVVQGV